MKLSLITGASSGIGRAIALAIAAENSRLYLTGRNVTALESVAREAHVRQAEAVPCQADFESTADLEQLAQKIVRECNGLDILIHSAGVVAHGALESADPREFDRHYQINVRAPYILTQRLLPLLRARRGQVVFINSSAGLTAPANVSQYAASKHALKALADAFREEVNADGIRVINIFLGRTATPMQAAVFAAEGKTYRPELLIQPEDVAAAVVCALDLPRTAEITEIRMRPMKKSY